MNEQGRRPGEDYHPWTTYMYAREEALRRGDRRIGTEHLLLGLLREPELALVLGHDVEGTREALRSMDRQALAAIGIDPGIDAPPIAVREDAPRPTRPTLKELLGHRFPLTPAAKDALRAASRSMRRGRSVAPQRVLLALLELEAPDPAVALLAALGVDRGAVRAALE
jgi:hypothetical protein